VLFLVFFYLQVWLSLFTEKLQPRGFRKLRTAPMPPELKALETKELPRTVFVVKCLFGLTTKESQILHIIVNAMAKHTEKSGVKFCIQYYSEVIRLIFEYLSETRIRNTKNWVAQWRDGLPKIIGAEVRDWIRANRDKIIRNHSSLKSGNRMFILFRAIVSILCLFRAMSPKHVLKFDSVTAPFTGTGTLSDREIRRALRSVGITRLNVRSPRFFWSNKGGVNASFAFMSIGLDFLGIIGHPHVWFGHVSYAFSLRYWTYLAVFFMMTVWCLPLFLMSYFIHGVFPLGRLAVILELKGKARVVGITDYWTQILFKPLHDSIYSALGKIPWDGTNDQLGPINQMLEGKPEYIVSVDLTAATDRLPVELQARILSALGLPGAQWRSILDRSYWYQDTEFRYSVGQPMGAYSSFAMLALTNHCIVHAALLKMGLQDSIMKPDEYAVLGDDVAISGEALADSYISILNMLGVEVNPIKGFRGSLLEFAKNIYTIGGTNISPMGAKILLRSSREPIYLPAAITDMAKKRYFDILSLELPMFTTYLEKLFNKSSISMVKWLFCSLGPQSGLWARPEGYVTTKSHQILFERFLALYALGISRTDVTKFFERQLLSKSLYSLGSFLSAGENTLRVFGYTRKPYIWSSDKFDNLEIQTPENTATLAMASGSVVLLPVLLWYFLSASIAGLYLYILTVLLGERRADPR